MAEDKTKNNVAEIDEEEGDDEPLIYTLEFDNGEIMEAEEMGTFVVGEKEYIALIPDDGSDDVYIYGYDDETNSLMDIENDEEFDKAVAEFDRIMAEAE